ncbi:MAG TPA: molybdenum cofactor biosynthesis protein MoaE [Syntrophorhabdaceae bacterium]|nr:molybdenum cofactor biosynthesis protein MoaE [Syntrophorhabdaceae bacterium]
MIEQWITEIKRDCNSQELGMILLHDGIVRATTKDGRQVRGMNLSYNKPLLASTIEKFRRREGIADVRVWINEGRLNIGDDIMKVCIAGRFRTDVLPALQELLTIIKKEIVHEEEELV